MIIHCLLKNTKSVMFGKENCSIALRAHSCKLKETIDFQRVGLGKNQLGRGGISVDSLRNLKH